MGLLTIPVLLAILQMLTALFTFLNSVQGQALVATWAADHDRFRKDLAAGWKQIEWLFRGQT